MDLLFSMIVSTLIYSTPIIIAGLGGMFSERSGVVNIALEGLMMFGGFFAGTAVVFIEPHTAYAPWIAILIASIAGGLISIVHAFLSINLKADQVISGTAINLIAGGITIYLSQIIFGKQRTEAFSRGFTKSTYDGLSQIPIIGKIFFTNIYPTVFVALFLVIVCWYVMYKTPFGLRLRATGEHPHAVDSLGVNVYRMRYIGVILSGCLSGLAGGIVVLTFDNQYSIASIHGLGFIALAALVFGKWKPGGLLAASLFFGFSQILGIYATSISGLENLPNEFFKILPYLMTIIALIVFSGKSVGPKAAGVAYDKGER